MYFQASATLIRTARRAGSGIAHAAMALAVLSASAMADDLIVKYDQSQLVKLDRPAREVIIGNATIADVTIQSENLLVVTGKSFGITNIIVLDAERNIIDDRRILVQRDEVKVVNLHKGSKRQSYNCSPQCNPTITIGDDSDYFEATAKLSERKLKLSEGNPDAGNTQP